VPTAPVPDDFASAAFRSAISFSTSDLMIEVLSVEVAPRTAFRRYR
jgi:hypothetical protein